LPFSEFTCPKESANTQSSLAGIRL